MLQRRNTLPTDVVTFPYDAVMSGESERETRIRRIDPRLQTAGWTPQAFRSIGESKLAKAAAIREYPTTSGPADYGLCEAGDVRGVVEAKRLAVGPQEVLAQAKTLLARHRSGTAVPGAVRRAVPVLHER